MTWEPVRLDGVTCKVEGGGYGVDAVPAVGTDALRVSERVWSSFRVIENWPNTNEDAASGAIFGMAPGGPRGRYVEANIAWQTRGAGSDLVVEADPLLQACGWTQVDGTLKFDYTLAASAHASTTCYLYGGGLLVKALGCRGTVTWDLTPGRLGIVRFRMLGRLGGNPTTLALPGGFGYDATAPLATVGLTLTVGSWSPALSKAMFVQNADIQLSEDANNADGLGEFDWGECNPFFSLTARKPPLATYDPFADSAPPPTSRAIVWTLGNTQFNRLKGNIPNAYVQTPDPAQSQKMADWDLRFLVRTATPTLTSD
jgi:hypothetical protein